MKLDASSPEMKNMRFSNNQYLTKIFQCLQKKLGRSSIDATFSIEIIQNKCDDLEIVHGVIDESHRSYLGPDFQKKLEICINTSFENNENVFNVSQKFVKEHSEEILNVRSLDYS